MFSKSCIDIIKEASASEDYNATNIISDELKTSFIECVNDMPIIDKKVVLYNRNMVPVFKNESSYFIEMDNVFKYMKSFEITDIKEAMENIAEVNNINIEDMSLVIESEDYMSSVIESAIAQSKAGDKTLLENCELTIKLINMLESEGINVVLTK